MDRRFKRLSYQVESIYQLMLAVGSFRDAVVATRQPRLKAKLKSMHSDLDEIYKDLKRNLEKSSTYQVAGQGEIKDLKARFRL